MINGQKNQIFMHLLKYILKYLIGIYLQTITLNIFSISIGLSGKSVYSEAKKYTFFDNFK